MTTSKQAKLSITLKSVELIKELSLGLAPIGCIATRHFCSEISRTLINQAGEIDALTAKIQNLATASNSYELHWDSLIFAIMGADAKADIIDAVDVERITAAAITAVKKLASDRDEKQRVAEAFQTASENPLPDASFSILHRPYYQNGVHAGYITMPGNTELTDEDEANLSSFIQRSSKGIGTFKDIFVYSPAPTFASERAHYRKLIESEISDFFAGLYQPGAPEIQDGAKLQTEIMNRIGLVFSTDGEI
jgi:hypothetical protein